MEIHLQEKYWMKEAWNVIYISCTKKRNKICANFDVKSSLSSAQSGAVRKSSWPLAPVPSCQIARTRTFFPFSLNKKVKTFPTNCIFHSVTARSRCSFGVVWEAALPLTRKKRHERGEKTLRHHFHRLPCSTVIASHQLGQCWFLTHVRAHTQCVRVCTEGT